MAICYIFDIDGTLTPSRQPINPAFRDWFLRWGSNKNIYFVTGSDREKTIEQIGLKMWLFPQRVYQSCGNVVYEQGELVRSEPLDIDCELEQFLQELLNKSPWYGEYGNNIEKRVGLINFSTIGRECPQDKREEYANTETERSSFVKLIMDKFPHLEAAVGGQISIDIYMKNKNKAQVLDDIEGYSIFFGDRCEDGNDAPIARLANVAYHVGDWMETWDILKSLTSPEKYYEQRERKQIR